MIWDIHKNIIHQKWKKRWFESHPYDIAEYSWDYLFTGGKEIRSKLFCQLWDYLSPDSTIVIELAFAIECIHVASLILDDTPWMDNATERRGRKTLHITFSPKKALLIANDIMYMAAEIWINNKPMHIAENVWKSLLISKVQRLSMGQWLDLGKSGTLIELASLKTGVLFELVTETVAICNHLDTTFWRIWGNNLGILFQWVDDWIDREEDIAQKNRNAFNEAFDNTLQTYITIWKKLERHIGTLWFTCPFGIFMKKYFTEQINISNEINIISSLQEILTYEILWTLDDDKCKQYINNIIISEINDPDLKNYPNVDNYIKGLNHKIIIERIFFMSIMIFEIPSPKKLWMIKEDDWENYIKNIIPKLKHYNEYTNLETYIEYIIPKINNLYNNNYKDIREKILNISNYILISPTWVDDNKWKQYIDDIRQLIVEELT